MARHRQDRLRRAACGSTLPPQTTRCPSRLVSSLPTSHSASIFSALFMPSTANSVIASAAGTAVSASLTCTGLLDLPAPSPARHSPASPIVPNVSHLSHATRIYNRHAPKTAPCISTTCVSGMTALATDHPHRLSGLDSRSTASP
ncbi:hypothetical protein BC831DRAFT_467343 [Entophlyctis helioformis]|nr:hypothetical protein BC831DRAFT_467343 [Entophlyctis helioformis]